MMEGVKKGDFSLMDFNHHILSGFKASMSEQLMHCIDAARRGTGGAGY